MKTITVFIGFSKDSRFPILQKILRREILFESTEIFKDTSDISLHTGKELERLTIHFDIEKKYLNEFKKYLTYLEEENIISLDENEHAIKRYNVTNFSYKILDNAQYLYVFNIEEVEKLNIVSLIIAGVEVFPYKYSEEYNKGLIISASIRVTEHERKEIEDNIKKDSYFKVIRNGINEDEIDMRLGKIL
jgi:hypothetical protein